MKYLKCAFGLGTKIFNKYTLSIHIGYLPSSWSSATVLSPVQPTNFYHYHFRCTVGVHSLIQSISSPHSSIRYGGEQNIAKKG